MPKLDIKKLKFPESEHEIVQDDGTLGNEMLSERQHKAVVLQIDSEYNLAYKFNEAKRKTWLQRLKLYNNQRRKEDSVGDPLLFATFNTIHAALWDDRLGVAFEGRGGMGDDEVEENLNALAEFDYDVMQKAALDYEWNWDAEFFGRGLVLMMDFDRTIGVQAPMPTVIDPTTWIRDPRATSVNGDIRGNGSMRFGGREIGLSYWEMKDNPAYFNLKYLRKDKEAFSLIDEMRQGRREAQGTTHFPPGEEELGKFDNYEFRILQWFATIKGEKYLVELANNRSLLVRIQKLRNQKRWCIEDRALYPMSHDWDGVSIPDLVEDKQRMRSVLLNLATKAAKADVMPTYAFDQTRIKNKNDLNFNVNKFIGIDGRVDNAIMGINKPTMHQYVNLIMDILDVSAQRALSTPELQQGVTSKSARTLGELELVSSKVDTRYSMNAKLYGISEANFWRAWYKLYKTHFKDKIDEKVIRIQGVNAPIWRPLHRDNIIAEIDPDVRIESRVIVEAKRLRDRNAFSEFTAFALQDPEANKRFLLKKLAKLQGMPKEEVNAAFPPTVEELHAEDENEMLNQGKMPQISVTDDHMVHLEIHGKAQQNEESMAHIRQHKKLMVKMRQLPEFFPAPTSPFAGTALPGKAKSEGGRPAQATSAIRGQGGLNFETNG